MLIPALESRVRTIVKDETSYLEKVMDAKFESLRTVVDAKLESLAVKVDLVDRRIDSLDRKIPVVQELAEIKARLTQVEKNQSKF